MDYDGIDAIAMETMITTNTEKNIWPIKYENGWRIRSNLKIDLLHKRSNIEISIKIKRLEWTGHLLGRAAVDCEKIFLKESQMEKETDVKMIRLG